MAYDLYAYEAVNFTGLTLDEFKGRIRFDSDNHRHKLKVVRTSHRGNLVYSIDTISSYSYEPGLAWASGWSGAIVVSPDGIVIADDKLTYDEYAC